MEIRFTEHALYQLKERYIKKADVLRVLQSPDKIIPQNSVRNRAVRKLRKRNKTYLLVVVYDTVRSHKDVVTAFLTSKIEKYL